MKRLTVIALAALCAAPNCQDTGGKEWQGSASACDTVEADATIQTLGDPYLNKEYGVVTPKYFGHTGCDYGFVIDYNMPPPLTNVNPGWHWAWIHVASRIPDMTAAVCNNSWTSLRVYAYWIYQNAPHEEMVLETYRKGSWNGSGCDFGLPSNVWMSSVYTRVRAVSQHGNGLLKDQLHYSYFVANND